VKGIVRVPKEGTYLSRKIELLFFNILMKFLSRIRLAEGNLAKLANVELKIESNLVSPVAGILGFHQRSSSPLSPSLTLSPIAQNWARSRIDSDSQTRNT